MTSAKPKSAYLFFCDDYYTEIHQRLGYQATDTNIKKELYKQWKYVKKHNIHLVNIYRTLSDLNKTEDDFKQITIKKTKDLDEDNFDDISTFYNTKRSSVTQCCFVFPTILYPYGPGF
jgi:hypothetical protein